MLRTVQKIERESAGASKGQLSVRIYWPNPVDNADQRKVFIKKRSRKRCKVCCLGSSEIERLMMG